MDQARLKQLATEVIDSLDETLSKGLGQKPLKNPKVEKQVEKHLMDKLDAISLEEREACAVSQCDDCRTVANGGVSQNQVRSGDGTVSDESVRVFPAQLNTATNEWLHRFGTRASEGTRMCMAYRIRRRTRLEERDKRRNA
jgi:hypothetical protein